MNYPLVAGALAGILGLGYFLAAVTALRSTASASQKALPIIVVVFVWITMFVVHTQMGALAQIIAAALWGIVLLSVHAFRGIAVPSSRPLHVFGVLLAVALITYAVVLLKTPRSRGERPNQAMQRTPKAFGVADLNLVRPHSHAGQTTKSPFMTRRIDREYLDENIADCRGATCRRERSTVETHTPIRTDSGVFPT
jgi:predicted membrane protein